MPSRETIFALFALVSLLSLAILTANPSAAAFCGNGCGSCAGSYSPNTCSSTSNILSPGTCYVCDTFNTIYTQALNGISSGSIGIGQTLSPASSVDKSNTDNAMWFLTCPLNPYVSTNQVGEWLFYTSPYNNNKYAFIAGDVCTADKEKLITTLSLPVNIIWSNEEFAAANIGKIEVYNSGRLAIRNLAYSPMLKSGGINTVSSSFSTNSYVFEQIPAEAQKSLWTWSAAFADFPGTDVKNTQTVNAIPKMQLESGVHLCEYKYNFSETTTLNTMTNYYVPFNSATFNQVENRIDYTTFNTPILPIFGYENNVLSPNLPVMSSSYDIFSPWNYANPFNAINPFPIDVPGSFLFTYSKEGANTLGTAPSNTLASENALHNAIQFYMGDFYRQSEENLGTFGLSDPNIENPISITAVANNYIFILSKTSGNVYYLSVLKSIPKGYFDTHGNTTPSTDKIWSTTNEETWDSSWKKQWELMADVQYSDMYVVSKIELSNYLSAFVQKVSSSPSCTGSGTCSNIDSFTPLNISADSAGDVYIAGKASATYSQGEYWQTSTYPGILGIPGVTGGAPGTSDISATTGDWSTTSGVDVLNEIATSPDGTLIYAASASTGTIYRFARDLTQNGNPIDLTFTESMGDTAQGGSGGYSQLSIPYYLNGGGLYGVKFDGLGTNPPDVMAGDNMKDVATQFDMPSFHHPIGLANVNGYIYVLDDWRGKVGESNDCFWVFCSENGGIEFDFLVLRALDPAGANVPLNPTLFNDMLSPESCTASFAPEADSSGKAYSTDTLVCVTSLSQLPNVSCSPAPPCVLAQKSAFNQYSGAHICASYSCVSTTSSKSTYYEPSGSFTATSGGRTWPPYGWILSANITTSSPSKKQITFCSSADANQCTFNPNNLPSTYDGNWKPIGPHVAQSFGGILDVSFNAGYDGTISLLLKKHAKCFTGVDWTGYLTTDGECGMNFLGTNHYNPYYSEFIVSNFSVENYTKYFDGNVGAICYTDSVSDVGQGCKRLDDVSSMVAPVYVAKSPFRYLESFGSAQIPTMAGMGIGVSATGSGTDDSVTVDGPPKITISHGTAGWGTQVQISAKAALNQDTVVLKIDSYAVATGTGSATFVASLSCPSDASLPPEEAIKSCVAPGSHTVGAEETGNSTSTSSGSFTIESTPMLILSPVVQAVGSVETITAVASSSDHQVEISIDGAVKKGPETGTVSYSQSSLPAGTHTVTATDTTNNEDTTQKLYVMSTTLPSTDTLYPAAVNIQSNIAGYAMVPFSYTYDLSQHYSDPTPGNIIGNAYYTWTVPSGFSSGGNCVNSASPSCTITVTTAQPGTYTVSVKATLKTVKSASASIKVVLTGGGSSASSGASASGISLSPDSATMSKNQSITLTVPENALPCGALGLPSDPSQEVTTRYTYALTNAASDTLQAMVEGGPTYLKDIANNGHYIANVTNEHLILPPQIQYNIQNDKIFGSIWANVTYCTGPQQSQPTPSAGQAPSVTLSPSSASIFYSGQMSIVNYDGTLVVVGEASGGTGPYMYKWTYDGLTKKSGCGEQDTTCTVAHAGDSNGVFPVHLYVLGSDGVSSNVAGTQVTVSGFSCISMPYPMACYYTVSPQSASIQAGKTLTFTALSNQAQPYDWTVTGGLQKVSPCTSTSDTCTVQFPAGSQQAQGTVGLAPSGGMDFPATVVLSPTIAISPAPVTIVNGQSQILTGTISGGTTPYTYAWTISPELQETGGCGEGNTDSASFCTIQGTVAGTYWAKLQATEANGALASLSIPVEVQGQTAFDQDCSVNNQAVLGATRQLQYYAETYVQEGGGSYQTFGSTPYYGYGPELASYGNATQATAEINSIPTPLQGDPIGFSFTDIQLPMVVPLFSFYKQVLSDSPLQLLLNAAAYCVGNSGYCSSPLSLRGYQQLIYVFTDRFNNVISVPVEADVADPVTINLDVSTMIDQSNANSTTLSIDGQAGIYTNFGVTFTPLKNQSIYLYYNNNLNFKDLNPMLSPLYAVDCAYGIDNQLNPSSCVTSNPLYTTSADNREANSQQVTYSPSFRSDDASCNQPTQGLLKQQYFKCNIYDNSLGASLSSSCPRTGALQKCDSLYPDVVACLSSSEAGLDPQSYCSNNPDIPQESAHYASYLSCAALQQGGGVQFCEPTDFTTGNGICTSQLGLMKVVTTNDIGGFSFTTTACGSRQNTLTAKYYGWPPPEPISARQIPLGFTANLINGQCSSIGNCTSGISLRNEFNYRYAPTQASQTVQTGLFLLGFGSFDLAVIMLSIATSAVLLFRQGIMRSVSRMVAKRKRKRM